MQPLKQLSDFGKWKINMNHYNLENEKGEEIFVEPRLLKLLNLLYANANKVITRDELVDHVWEGVVVTEESLSTAVFDLRKFLVGNFKSAPQIVTIRKVGYKLELKAQTAPTHRYRIVRMTAKVLVYILIAVSMFIILVRAIRYEN